MRTHLVLSAGGMKALSYPGAIALLEDEGIEFNSISCCSGGTFFGACLALGVTGDQLIRIVHETDLRELLGARAMPLLPALAANLSWPRARYAKPGIGRVFLDIINREEVRKGKPERDPTFGELEIPLATVALDLISYRTLVYSTATTPAMKVSRALEIATAMPFLYPPHEKDKRVVVDGALVSQTPVWLALSQPGNCPIVVLAPARARAHPKKRGLLGFVGMMVEVGSVSRDLQLVEQITRAVRVEIQTSDVQYDDIDLTDDTRTELIANGRSAVQDHLNEIKNVAKECPDAYAKDRPPRLRTILPEGLDDDELAERGGTKALELANSLVSKQVRNQVFISYARAGEGQQWVGVFRERLSKYGENLVWDDSAIPTGSQWRSEIDQALKRAKVALLLIDEKFLASQFVNDVELFEFFDAREQEGLALIPVLVGPCNYRQTKLGELQFVHGTPLGQLSAEDQRSLLDNVERQVTLALDERYRGG